MLYPSIDEIRKKADSKYTLVVLTSKRARDIVEGKPLMEYEEDDLTLEDLKLKREKPVSTASEEISGEYITYKR